MRKNLSNKKFSIKKQNFIDYSKFKLIIFIGDLRSLFMIMNLLKLLAEGPLEKLEFVDIKKRMKLSQSKK